MALGDKKSGLQPSSVQAQQYRLQFSNLTSRAARTITSGQAAQPISRPAISTLAPPPAGPTTGGSSQGSDTSQGSGTTPSIFKKAAFFDGATALSASLVGGNEAGTGRAANNQIEIALVFKPALLSDNTRRTIFHTYSGSAMSQSLELYTIGSNLYLEMTHDVTTLNGQTVPYTWYTSTDLGWAKAAGYAEHTTNQYTYYANRMNPIYVASTFVILKGNTMTFGGVGNKTSFPIEINPNFNTSNNTHFYIGGSPAKNSYFSGSIASITFTSGSYLPNQTWGDIALRDKPAETATPQLRTYTFNNAVVETTGSQARYSRPLVVVTGSLTYVDGYLRN